MPDAIAIAQFVTAAKGMVDIVQVMVGLRDSQMLDIKRGELLRQVVTAHQAALAAQTAHAATLERIGELEKQVAGAKAWAAEKERYQLAELEAPGSRLFAYAVKDGMRGEEPAHYLCANCYAGAVKSVLQLLTRAEERKAWACSRCKQDLDISRVGF